MPEEEKKQLILIHQVLVPMSQLQQDKNKEEEQKSNVETIEDDISPLKHLKI